MSRNLHTLTYQLFLSRPSFEEAVKGLEGLSDQELPEATERLRRLYVAERVREYISDIRQWVHT